MVQSLLIIQGLQNEQQDLWAVIAKTDQVKSKK